MTTIQNGELNHEDLVGAKVTVGFVAVTIQSVNYAEKDWKDGTWMIEFTSTTGSTHWWKQHQDGGNIRKEVDSE